MKIERSNLNKENQKHYTDIMYMVKKVKLLSVRKSVLESLGYKVEEKRMGNGGVGQIHMLPKRRELRIQVGYGHSKYNYADCVVLSINE